MIAWLMGLKTIAPRELQERLASSQPIGVIDVNSLQSFSKAHVPGARHLDPVAFAASDLPADPAATLVFYCSNPMCRKAPNAARRAKQMGYADVRVLSAGISGWVGDGLPTQGAA
jgi:rhodanese-related sulfurtransferase